MDYEFLSEFENNDEEMIFFDDVDEMNSQLAMDLVELELEHDEI